MSRLCRTLPEHFCYICGKYMISGENCNMTAKIQEAYQLYFKLSSNNGKRSFIPNFCCIKCKSSLLAWMRGSVKRMGFAVPMIWREPTDHVSDCYFCVTETFGYSKQSKSQIKYPAVNSVSKPVPHDDDHPVPIPPNETNESSSIYNAETVENMEKDDTDDKLDILEEGQPLLVNQKRLNELVAALELSKEKSELLASRLSEWNLLEQTTKITVYRDRQKDFVPFFDVSEELYFCSDIDGLMGKMKIKHIPNEWRLFIDTGKSSLKAVLLHIGNKHPSVPIGYSKVHKESYHSIKFLFEKIQYSEYEWLICADLKVVALITGLQLGYTKFMCFLCEWDSRDKASHFKIKVWKARKADKVGELNVQNTPLVKKEKVILPPLHIKLGIMKAFVKGMDQDGEGFMYLKEKFPGLSNEKIKEGVFVGPDIRKLIQDDQFDKKLNNKELKAWKAFKSVISNFLGNRKSSNYKKLVEDMLKSLNQLGCNMSLKLHFLHSHLDFFPDNLGDYSDEHGEKFHQSVSVMEKRYNGKSIINMLADYIWWIVNINDNEHHKRKSPGSAIKRKK